MLLGVITVSVVVVGAVATVIIYVERKIAKLEANLRSFVAPGKDSEGKDIPSPFFQVIDSAGQVLANRMTQSISGSLLGVKSGLSREQKALAREAQEAVIASDPALSIASQFMPSLAKANPLLIAAIQRGLSGILGGNKGTPVPSNGKSEKIGL